MTNHFRIAILGGGNLGNSLATGLLATGHFQANDLIVTRRKIQFLNHLQQQNVRITSDNRGAVEESRFVLMTVKPHQMESLLQEIRSVIVPEKHILVSSVTGFPIRRIRSICGNVPVIRIMPNTAAAIGESMTCLAAQEDDQEALTEVKELFDLLGIWKIQVSAEADKIKELGEKGRLHPLIRMMDRAGYTGGQGKKGIYAFYNEVLEPEKK